MKGRYEHLLKKSPVPRDDKFTVTIRRKDALGDVLASTVVADKLVQMGRRVNFQSLAVCHAILKRIKSVHTFSEPTHDPHANLDGAYENNPRRAELPFAQMFVHEASQQLRKFGIDLGPATNCKPKLCVSEEERAGAVDKLKDYPKPWVFICPRSNTNLPRTIPDDIWRDAAREIKGTKFWLGSHGPSPEGIVDLNMRDIDALIVQLSAADLMVTVDTGPMHFAAALGVPIVALCQASSPELHLNDQTDFVTMLARNDLDCLNCQSHTCPKDRDHPPCQNADASIVALFVNEVLKSRHFPNAVVPIYRPSSETLNSCLTNLISQTSQVVLTQDRDGRIPGDVIRDPSLYFHITKPLSRIGYGRNVNYGVRHAFGEFVLIINDDVFLKPGAVSKMMECMKPDVGMVACLLRYPDGRIYHAGKEKNSGDPFWHHIDYLHAESRFKEPVEMENVCGACVLVRRKAHFQIDGFDEDFFMFCEDDDYALKMRREGWKIIFTPLAEGIHLESQSVHLVGDKWKLMADSQAILKRKWNLHG